MARKPEKSNSVVSDRLRWLEKRSVRVKLTMYEAIEAEENSFVAIYEDVYPIGSGYFFLFNENGKQRLVSTTAVREICPLD